MPNETDYKTQLGILIEIQHLDAQIYDLRQRSEAFPLKIKEMDEDLDRKKVSLNKAEDDLKKLQVSKNQKETDMQVKEDLIKKHQTQLYQIKNNKEYTALQQEIQNIKADISVIEEAILNFFDNIDSAKKSCDDEKKAFEAEKKRSESDKALILSEEKKVNDELEEMVAKRVTAAKEVDRPLLSQYEQILKSRGRTALSKVDLNEERCGECQMTLRPQIINEARLKKALVLCENCSRMLYAE